MGDETLNDLFPGNGRPDVPEFWRLSEIVLKHDADAQAQNGLEHVIERYIPEAVAGYMAAHRAMFMLQMQPDLALLRLIQPTLGMLIHLTSSASWADGFCAGAAYQKKYGEKDSE